MIRKLLIVLASLVVSAALAADEITKEVMTSGGLQRTYYLFVPERAAGKPAPLIVTLHGSGRDGRILVDHWQDVAKKEGIILAGPDAINRQGWSMTNDGADFLHDLIEALKTTHTIDPKRVYLFGHSAGAIHGLQVGVLESEYFAAVAVHAGVLSEELAPFAKSAPRKMPIAIWVGTDDRSFPVANVRATRDGLNSFGYDVQLTEIKGHTHDYYGRSSQINKETWTFLKDRQLANEPKYQQYAIGK